MILNQIFTHKKEEVAAAMAAVSLNELKDRVAASADCPRGFARTLRACRDSGNTAVIAEVKKGSPSKGVIRADFDPVAIARTYAEAGAACLSVLTDARFFLGDLGYLAAIREQVVQPLLRKDFLYHPYQIWEAKAAGADAVLLIAAMLGPTLMFDLTALSTELSLDVLVEVHNESEIEMACATGCELIGINNRNLRTFVTDLKITEKLLPLIPRDRFVIAESGIRDRDDIVRLQRSGAKGFLIGESLMREADIAGKLRELLGTGSACVDGDL